MTNIAINLVNETAKTVARTEAASNQQNADDPLFVTPPFWAWVVGVPLVIGALYHFARVSRDKRSAIVADKSAKERDRQAYRERGWPSG